MCTIGSFHYLNLLSVFPKVDHRVWQLTEVTVVTDQKNVRYSSGYVGDKSAKDCAEDYSEKIDRPEMLVKCWCNEDGTLREVAVLSRHTAPFDVTVKMKNIPSVNEVLNRKYMDILRSEGLERTYQLLQANRSEYPMIPIDEIRQILGHLRIPPQNGLVNLREEVTCRRESTDGYLC